MDVPSQEDLSLCLSQLHSLALTRHGSCLTLPTIASPTALSRGLDTLHDSLPSEGLGLQDTTRYLLNEVQPTLPPGQSATRYFGFVTGGVTPAATVADWFLTLLDPMPQVHLPGESYSTLIEAYTIGMLCDLISMNRKKWTGTFTTGATASNVLGLACGRERVLQRVMRERGWKGEGWSVAEQGIGYDSEDAQQVRVPPVHVYVAQPHASVYKAASLVGIGRSRVIDVGQKNGSDAIHGLDFDLSTLEAHLSRCQSRKHGAIVVAGLGEVNTGALTAQLPALRRLCDQYGAWLHVDAAFSAFVCLLEGFEWISRHLDEYADSITSDAHKQLNVPYDCGLFFIRRRKDERIASEREEDEHVNPEASALEDVLGPGKGKGPAYLAPPPPPASAKGQSKEGAQGDAVTAASSTAHAHRTALLSSLPSPLFRNIENSRRLRALPVYATLLCYGKRGIADLVRRNVDFARAVEEWMRHGKGREWYEVLTPECGEMEMDEGRRGEPQPWKGAWGTTVLLFRPKKGVEAAEVIARIKATREVYVSPTSWGGKGAIRLAVCNWRTGIEGLEGEGSKAETLQQSRDFEVTTRVLADVMRRGQDAVQSA